MVNLKSTPSHKAKCQLHPHHGEGYWLVDPKVHRKSAINLHRSDRNWDTPMAPNMLACFKGSSKRVSIRLVHSITPIIKVKRPRN